MTLHDDRRLTVLGPTPERLAAFIDTWEDEVSEAIERGSLDPDIVSPGLEPMGSSRPPVHGEDADLLQLAESDDSTDSSKANGSSISLLLEYEGRRILLAGDAFADDLLAGIQTVSPGKQLHLDLFKLPTMAAKRTYTEVLLRRSTANCGCSRRTAHASSILMQKQSRVPSISATTRCRCCHLRSGVPSMAGATTPIGRNVSSMKPSTATLKWGWYWPTSASPSKGKDQSVHIGINAFSTCGSGFRCGAGLGHNSPGAGRSLTRPVPVQLPHGAVAPHTPKRTRPKA